MEQHRKFRHENRNFNFGSYKTGFARGRLTTEGTRSPHFTFCQTPATSVEITESGGRMAQEQRQETKGNGQKRFSLPMKT